MSYSSVIFIGVLSVTRKPITNTHALSVGEGDEGGGVARGRGVGQRVPNYVENGTLV